jgi:hypothetical protein
VTSQAKDGCEAFERVEAVAASKCVQSTAAVLANFKGENSHYLRQSGSVL